MTKEQALDKIKELEEYIKELDMPKFGYKDDDIFLLSKEEYKKVRVDIPKYDCCRWWLRSPGDGVNFAALVGSDGYVNSDGSDVYRAELAIRPVVRINNYNYPFNFVSDLETGKHYIRLKNDLIMPLTLIYNKEEKYKYYIFDIPLPLTQRFDRDSNDYETSEIRRYLLSLL